MDFPFLLKWLQNNLIDESVSIEFVREIDDEGDILLSGEIIGIPVMSLEPIETIWCNQNCISINEHYNIYFDKAEIDEEYPSSLMLFSNGKNTVNLVKDDGEWSN